VCARTKRFLFGFLAKFGIGGVEARALIGVRRRRRELDLLLEAAVDQIEVGRRCEVLHEEQRTAAAAVEEELWVDVHHERVEGARGWLGRGGGQGRAVAREEAHLLVGHAHVLRLEQLVPPLAGLQSLRRHPLRSLRPLYNKKKSSLISSDARTRQYTHTHTAR
jgi:hypothetical protein